MNKDSVKVNPYGLREYSFEIGTIDDSDEGVTIVGEECSVVYSDEKFYRKEDVDALLEEHALYRKTQEIASAINEAALWKSRWRYANTMIRLFKSFSNNSYGYYYTASGMGPSIRRGIVEFVPGKFIEYKHTEHEWVPIWLNVGEKLLNKVRESNKKLKALGIKEV